MCRILVLDDDESIRLLYEEELTDEGYDVISGNDGIDICTMVLEKRPDLIILDLKLGTVSGCEVLKKLRTKDVAVPVILCTAYPVSQKEAGAMGAHDVVVKRSDLGELKLKIRKALHANTSTLPLSIPATL